MCIYMHFIFVYITNFFFTISSFPPAGFTTGLLMMVNFIIQSLGYRIVRRDRDSTWGVINITHRWTLWLLPQSWKQWMLGLCVSPFESVPCPFLCALHCDTGLGLKISFLTCQLAVCHRRVTSRRGEGNWRGQGTWSLLLASMPVSVTPAMALDLGSGTWFW